MTTNEFPSLSVKHDAPNAWIQWKGTDVCMYVHCLCGELTHIDADFTYHIECAKCGQVYECDGHIKLWPLSFKPEGTCRTDP
jgi:hypothetical protein